MKKDEVIRHLRLLGSLWLWLDKPFEVKAVVPGEEQLALAFR
jgi:hypothetical protein